MFQLGSKLLSTLEKNRLDRNDENVKGIGWFLVCVGESLEKGSLISSRRVRAQVNAGEVQAVPSLAVAFCTAGDDIMNWSASMVQRRKK